MRPFPHDRLRRLSRDEAVQLSRWARSAPLAALIRRGREARGWLGAPIELSFEAAIAGAREAAPKEGVYALLDGVRPAGMYLDPRIASAIVERTLGAGAEAVGARGPLGEVERGVLGYALARWLGEGPYALGAVFAHPPALTEAVGPHLLWPFEISLGAAKGRGALWLPEPIAIGEAPPREAPPWLPITLWADAGEARLAAEAIAELRVGDVVLPDSLTIGLDGAGTIRLRAPRASVAWVFRSDGHLTLESIEQNTLPVTRGRRTPAEEPMADETIAKMADTPITLHIEVARLELTLGEVASLSVGEVLRSGRTLSERVTLRAGERAVAHGDLVDVDGELGVQITEIVGNP